MSFRRLGKEFLKMKKEEILEGVLAVNKPIGISSAQVVRDLQKHFNPSKLFAPWIESERISRARESNNQKRRRRAKQIQVKIGHGGTLDPLATGILIAGIGRGTKSLQNFLLCSKEYEAVVLFGTGTDTYDRVGKVLKRAPYKHITREIVDKALEKFRGKFMQLPPLFSALKMNGKPLYEYAREGREIPREIERRQVEVHELELVEWMEGGTHTHEAPTDEAGYMEVNVANQLWTQAGIKQKGHILDPTESDKDKENNEIQNKSDSLTSENAIHENEVKIDQSNNKPILKSETIIKQEISGKSPFFSRHYLRKPMLKGKKGTSSPNSHSQKRKRSNSQGSSHSLIHENKENVSTISKDAENTENSVVSDISISSPKVKKECISPRDENLSISQCEEQEKPPAVRLRMTVTSGFYVRSLCHDLGLAVNSTALMAELKRTRQGEYQIGESTLEYADLERGEEVWGPKVKRLLSEWQEKNPVP
ncbi:putative tRNA pseudouridine synthase 4 [Erysiphe neolycopersici]|uniref:tRNA pseudouridine(55) synthase n=1 Tax=Erysiphe neolycopersici TaxID=212602 RepID=A0A420HJH3_9PEZI|nr:putative tRNA pseudouridine synthase 4 [Erysiphe neolycopersici]